MTSRAGTPKSPSPSPPLKRVVFLLLDQFNILTFSAALEPLRLANKLAGYPCYQWKVISETGADIKSSSEISISSDDFLIDLLRDDLLLICGPKDDCSPPSSHITNWLRRQARQGVTIAGIGSATAIMARIGLLKDKRVTVHWQNQASFSEDFDNIDLSCSIYTMDGQVWTAAGSVATLDLILQMIARDHSSDLATQIADYLIYNNVRSELDVQNNSVAQSLRRTTPKLSRAVEIMNEHLEHPIAPADIAQTIGISSRQLERLFRRYLSKSPKKYYMELRLIKARNLLLQTQMPIINIALACGFSSVAHFSKCYREYYNVTPYQEKGPLATSQPSTTTA